LLDMETHAARQSASGNPRDALRGGIARHAIALGRFGLHMLVASILAPAIGAAALFFPHEVPPDVSFPERLLESLAFGLISLWFIWFLALPFGLLTYLLCSALRRAGVENRAPWAAVGAIVGLWAATFMSLWGNFPIVKITSIGTLIGLASGLVMRPVWRPRRGRAP